MIPCAYTIADVHKNAFERYGYIICNITNTFRCVTAHSYYKKGSRHCFTIAQGSLIDTGNLTIASLFQRMFSWYGIRHCNLIAQLYHKESRRVSLAYTCVTINKNWLQYIASTVRGVGNLIYITFVKLAAFVEYNLQPYTILYDDRYLYI